jgi:hypothetical protein
MALDSNIVGALSGTGADVNASRQLKVITETDVKNSASTVGAIKIYGANDEGDLTGDVALKSPEIDVDYRMRVSQDLILDEEVFNYTAQNTGKHSYSNTTMTNTWTAGQLTTNATSITTTTTGTQFSTYAAFPNTGTTTLSADIETAFSAQPVTNTFVEFGLGLPGTATTAPSDGVFFRLNSAGLQGIASFNGTETSTGVFPLSGGTGTWVYANNKRYQFIAYMGGVEAQFWVNDGTGAVLLGTIPLPSAQGRICMAAGMQLFYKHRITGGAAGGVLQTYFGAYSVRHGGTNNHSTASAAGQRMYGSYQGLSGGTMGSLANYANSANPTAAVPTNTTAALGSGLGGQFWETVSLAANTDGIICSYQVPAGTVNLPGRRLVVRGIGLTSYVQTVVAGGPYVAQYSLAFGHTAVSLATAEAATTKAPRRVPLAGFTQVVTAAQAVSTIVSQPGDSFMDFGDAPIFVNPGEFIQLVTKHVGTVGTAGTVAHVVTFVYGWE